MTRKNRYFSAIFDAEKRDISTAKSYLPKFQSSVDPCPGSRHIRRDNDSASLRRDSQKPFFTVFSHDVKTKIFFHTVSLSLSFP